MILMVLRVDSIETTQTEKKSISTKQSFWETALHWPWEIFLLLIGLGWLYWQTIPPGISSWIVEGWDSAVLQIAGSTWGIPHSPGYPLYIILSNLFVRLIEIIPGAWESSVVWRVSLWSTVTSLLTLFFTYWVVRRLSRNRGAAFLASFLLGASFIFWRAAIMAEVYSMNALIFALAYWLALVWDDDPRKRWLVALGLVVGSGLAHHRTSFILLPTVLLWALVRRPRLNPVLRQIPRWKVVLHRWLILIGMALIPLLTYLYLPWAATNRVGQTWLYADASDWNTFWFVVLTREWWGLVDFPTTIFGWFNNLIQLFNQQADQITTIGIVVGIVGLLFAHRYLWLLGPPFLALSLFGISYKVADLDSMLIPLTLTLCIGIGMVSGNLLRRLISWLIKLIRVKDEVLRGNWLSQALRWIFSAIVMILTYFFLQPMVDANYQAVDLSEDWQAVDLVEEVVAIAQAGTPLTIIGQDNSVLPDFIYSRVVLDQPVEALSTTTLARMPEEESKALLYDRFQQGHRVLVDKETLDLEFIPWLLDNQIFKAPTGHPYLWELLPRPMSNQLPPYESGEHLSPHQFLEGRLSIVAYHQHIVHKRTGCFLRLTLFWQAEDYIKEDYFVSVQPLGGETVLDKNDHLGLMRGFFPTSEMRPGELIRDEVDMLIRHPIALPGVKLVVNIFQIQGDQYPTFGEVTLPITVNSNNCNQK